MKAEKAILLYDANCPFCQFWVIFLVKHDSKDYFRLSPISEKWQSILAPFPNSLQLPETVAVWYNHKLLTQSDAVLFIAKHLPWPYRIWSIFSIVPLGLRNSIYRFVAKNRLKLKKECPLPSPELRDRIKEKTVNPENYL